jgi:hypothetical protein
LAFTVEPNFDLVFYSAVDSIHIRNIQRNPTVAGTIFDSREPSDTADGLQFLAAVEEVDSSELAAVIQRYFHQSFPDEEVRSRWVRPQSDFSGEAPQRFFKVRLAELYALDPDSPKIDRRVRLDIPQVRVAFERLGE